MMIVDGWSEVVNNNISIPHVTNAPRSYFESQNDILGGVDQLDDDYEWLLNSTSRNASRCYINITVLHEYIQKVVQNVSGLTTEERRKMEGDPLVLIVVVLLFYSCGIAISMIIYMKKEQSESDEEDLYKFYVEKARDRCDEYNNRGSPLNRLALQAVNTVNIVTLPDEQTKVTFV